jgi:hypothetical protein
MQQLHQEKFTAYLSELKSLQSITDFYEYEKKFSEIHSKFGNSMLEINIAEQASSSTDKVYKKKFKRNLEK